MRLRLVGAECGEAPMPGPSARWATLMAKARMRLAPDIVDMDLEPYTPMKNSNVAAAMAVRPRSSACSEAAVSLAGPLLRRQGPSSAPEFGC